MKVTDIKNRIASHVCMILVPENPQNPTDRLTQELTKLQLSEGELMKDQSDLDDAKAQVPQKENLLQASIANVDKLTRYI